MKLTPLSLTHTRRATVNDESVNDSAVRLEHSALAAGMLRQAEPPARQPTRYFGLGAKTAVARSTVSLCGIQRLRADVDWAIVPELHLGQGLRIPDQQDGWSCGVNGGARFGAMTGLFDPEDFRALHSLCPMTLGHRTDTSWSQDHVIIRLIARAVSYVARVGPAPRVLSSYLSANGVHCLALAAESKQPIEAALFEEILAGRPTIVLWMRHLFQMHYVNVVGINVRQRTCLIVNSVRTTVAPSRLVQNSKTQLERSAVQHLTLDELFYQMDLKGLLPTVKSRLGKRFNLIRLKQPVFL